MTTPDPVHSTARPVLTVATAPEGYEGEGFPVRRAFAKINTKLSTAPSSTVTRTAAAASSPTATPSG
ncbi:hypothetical protein GCM10010195_29670 [Kitasatospora griseola]|nr:hypothetical protein GCM10010195_29670 [Kitasatospora griseola]